MYTMKLLDVVGTGLKTFGGSAKTVTSVYVANTSVIMLEGIES